MFATESSAMKKHCFFIAGSWRDTACKERLDALASELISRDHQVVIIVDRQRTDLINSNGNPVFYTWPSPRPTQIPDMVFLSKLIQRYSPYFLIVEFGSVNVMMSVGLLMRVTYRIAFHHTLSTQIKVDVKKPLWKIKLLILRKAIIFKFATHLNTNSAAGMQELIINFGVPQNKIQIFHNSIRDPFIDSPSLLDVPKISNRFVCVGQLRPTKGQDILIRAAGLMKDTPGLQIEFVGSGPLHAYYEGLARELEVEDI